MLLCLILWQLPRLINRPFSAGFSAFTFLWLFLAVALKQSLNILNFGLVGANSACFEVLIALLVVLYVTFFIYKGHFGKMMQISDIYFKRKSLPPLRKADFMV